MITRIGGKRPVQVFLRRWIDAKGLTQDRLAERVDLSKGAVSKDIKKGAAIRADRLALYAGALGIDFFDLFRDPDAPSQSELLAAGTPDEMRQALDLIRTLRTGTKG